MDIFYGWVRVGGGGFWYILGGRGWVDNFYGWVAWGGGEWSYIFGGWG